MGNLELEVHEADIRRREDVCAVVAVAWRVARCAAAPGRDRLGREVPLCGVLAEQPRGAVQAGGRKLDRQPVRAPAGAELSITAISARAV